MSSRHDFLGRDAFRFLACVSLAVVLCVDPMKTILNGECGERKSPIDTCQGLQTKLRPSLVASCVRTSSPGRLEHRALSLLTSAPRPDTGSRIKRSSTLWVDGWEKERCDPARYWR